MSGLCPVVLPESVLYLLLPLGLLSEAESLSACPSSSHTWEGNFLLSAKGRLALHFGFLKCVQVSLSLLQRCLYFLGYN